MKYATAFIGSIAWIATCLFFCVNVTWWLLVVAFAPFLIYAQYNYLNTLYEGKRQIIVDTIEKEISELEWFVHTKSADLLMNSCDRLTEYLNDYVQYCGKDKFYENMLCRFENLLKRAQKHFEDKEVYKNVSCK